MKQNQALLKNHVMLTMYLLSPVCQFLKTNHLWFILIINMGNFKKAACEVRKK